MIHEPCSELGEPTPSDSQLAAIRAATLDASYVSMGSRRTTTVHEFYRYPARFSPSFARAVISAFSRPGDLVLDPFVGGGTTVVEARLAGRVGIGADLNALAAFVTRAKATPQTQGDLDAVRAWAERLPQAMNVHKPGAVPEEWISGGYLRHLGAPETWRLRKVIAQAIGQLSELPKGPPRDLARLALLRTAQWALDMRGVLPNVRAFRDQVASDILAMVDVASAYAQSVKAAQTGLREIRDTLVLHQAVPGLASHASLIGYPAPTLVLTSPPYPRVYVLYHRWKLRGRLETPAPFWIADCLDGRGQAHYTMDGRSRQTLDNYFERLRAAYADIAQLAGANTWVVQMVGFNQVDSQLPQYLEIMSAVGLEEVRFEGLATCGDGRLWRAVPSRRWWVTSNSRKSTAPHTAHEVVLIHRKRR